VLSGRPSGAHRIEGVGAGFRVPLWTDTLADEIQTISTEDAMAMARRLARDEGIFAGTSREATWPWRCGSPVAWDPTTP
jgi:cysteine synthase A